MSESQGTLVASLYEMFGLWAEDWGWLPTAETGEGADLPPPAEADVSEENAADAPPGPTEAADRSGRDLLAQAVVEDSFHFVFVPAGMAEGQITVPTTTDRVTLDQLDIAALLAARETVSFVADWDFGVVAAELRASEASESTPPTGTGGQEFEIVLSAVGSPAVNEAWL